MTLLNVYCKVRGCGLLLARVFSAPAAHDDSAWSGYVYLPICPKHGGGHGSVAKWVAAQVRHGRQSDRVPVGRWVPWSALRSEIDRARLTGTARTCAL